MQYPIDDLIESLKQEALKQGQAVILDYKIGVDDEIREHCAGSLDNDFVNYLSRPLKRFGEDFELFFRYYDEEIRRKSNSFFDCELCFDDRDLTIYGWLLKCNLEKGERYLTNVMFTSTRVGDVIEVLHDLEYHELFPQMIDFDETKYKVVRNIPFNESNMTKERILFHFDQCGNGILKKPLDIIL